MLYSPRAIFTILSGACFVSSMIWPKPVLVPVGGLCLCVANFVP